MKKKHSQLTLVSFLVVLFFFSSEVAAQRLYNEELDKKAQEAAKLAEEINSKSSFESQLKNLEIFSRRDAEVYFRGAKRQMELQISGFRTWGEISAFVNGVKTTLNSETFITDEEAKKINQDLKKECPDRETDLGKAVCKAKDELEKMSNAVEESKKKNKALDKELKSRLETISDLESLIETTQGLLESVSGSQSDKPIKELTKVFTNIAASYLNYVNKLEKINNEPRDELRLILQRIAVEALQIEIDHWKTVGEIQARRGEEQRDLIILVRNFENRLPEIATCREVDPGVLSQEKITETFSKAKNMESCKIPAEAKPLTKEQILSLLFRTLYIATALAARGETPTKLASLRLAQEEHRYSIRQSAVFARGYELVLSSGTKRLSRYYAGGIKPEKIAQLIYSAATVAIPAVIAGK